MGFAFVRSFQLKSLEIRENSGPEILKALNTNFIPAGIDRFLLTRTVLKNTIYGAISVFSGAKEKEIEEIVLATLRSNGLCSKSAQAIFDLDIASGGSNIPTDFRGRVALSRAGIKRPDVLILENALASQRSETRQHTRDELAKLMPRETQIYIERSFGNPDAYSQFVSIENGVVGDSGQITPESETDLEIKVRARRQAEVFARLDRKSLRLLAFGSRWFHANAGQEIFSKEDEADAAYLCVKGHASLLWQKTTDEKDEVVDVHPGRMVGDLSTVV
ncbi:hypothetical protein [Ruegeria atlantica]|uniref:hypothetical protein n=1 Tax=Ruegeria atlantica TaxID=81569 RepID=UPI00147B77F9|nr:hypothetical protein [Ruegeria atlantica]